MKANKVLAGILVGSLCVMWGFFDTAVAAERVVELKVPGCV